MEFVLFFIAAFLSVNVITADDASVCGDWEQYKDEHCYKLFDSFHTFSDAEKLCQTNNSTLVVIHYAEEQNFLANFLFTKKKVVDNLWVGAKFVGIGLFQWEDHTTVKDYSNWAPGYPRNMTDHCVQMSANEPNKGKWTDEPCARRNLAICQRMPPPSLRLLAETVIELKHTLQQTASRLAETEKTLTSKLAQNEKKLEKLKKEAIPIGFTYVQLPKDKAPGELWPSMTWTDISSEYEGVFFRVVGGGAGSFGVVQQENVPRLEMVHTGTSIYKIKELHENYSNDVSIPVTGWSDGLWTGSSSGSDLFINFKHTDTAEVRPKNMAIKVYKRTA